MLAGDQKTAVDLDQGLAALVSVLGDVWPHSTLLDALLHCELSVERAIDWLLNQETHQPTSSAGKAALLGPGIDEITPPLACKLKLKPTAEPVMIEQTSSVDPARPRSGISEGDQPWWKRRQPDVAVGNPGSSPRPIPLKLIPSILPDELAASLLTILAQTEAPTWPTQTFIINSKRLKASHTSISYMRTTLPKDAVLYYAGESISHRPFFPELEEAYKIVNEAVNKDRETQNIDDCEVPRGQWSGDLVIGNEYKNGDEITGLHSDVLTHLGPRPVIASLTLGATRLFQVKPHNEPATQFPLPHNSLLIMYPPFQEDYKHAVPGCKDTDIKACDILKGPLRIARYNLTFRHWRKEYIQRIPVCECGVVCELKAVMKSEGTRGRYYYFCVQGRKPHGCGFFQWLDLKTNFDRKK